MSLVAFHEAIPSYIEDKGNKLWLKIAIAGPQPNNIYVRIEPDNEEYLVEMSPLSIEGDWHYYEAEITKSQHIEQTDYLFKLVWSDKSSWLGSAGLEGYMPRNIHMFRFCHDRRFPSWTASRIFYQVFPERFANGDDDLTPKKNEYKYLDRKEIVVKSWGEDPAYESGGSEFFGGDLLGVKSRLDYLNDNLGITALYLNPVFESQSSHKYDTTDYFNVDPHFGGNDALQGLIEDAHNRDMKVVLDAVINHTSIMHPWFQAALDGSKELQAKYVFDGEGGYGSWKGHRNLPTLDYSNPDVVTEMVTGENSVIRHWLKPPYRIDGWRMDVIHMLGEGAGAKNNAQHLRTLRNVIKDENPEALLLGEHFFEATSWLQGDQEDCAMNYFGFAHPIRAFLTGLDIALHPITLTGDQFARWLREARARLSFDHQLLQFNQLDSHDTPRFLTMLEGDVERLKVSIGFLMSYIGTPCLYYGTEIGMEGGHDPGCRGCFPWDESQWNQDIFQFTRRWVKIRKTYSALSRGAMIDIYSDQDVMVFARLTENEQCLVLLNRGEKKDTQFEVNLPGSDSSWELVEGISQLDFSGNQCKTELPKASLQLFHRKT